MKLEVNLSHGNEPQKNLCGHWQFYFSRWCWGEHGAGPWLVIGGKLFGDKFLFTAHWYIKAFPVQ